MLYLICLFTLAASIATAQPANPPKLVYSTYIGTGPANSSNTLIGNTGGVVYGLAADSAGDAYVAGLGPASNNSACAFLDKLNPAGNSVIWTVCLPGLVNAVGSTTNIALAVDASGDSYALGNSPSYASLSPVLFKFSPNGQQLFSRQVACGSAAIALDASGDIYLAGGAGGNFQTTPGAYRATGGGCVVKLDPSGAIIYATYLDNVGPQAIAVDSSGEAWVAGTTCGCPDGGAGCGATPLIQPGQTSCTYGTANAIRKLDAAGANLLVTQTFGGGSSEDGAAPIVNAPSGVAIDAAGSAWVVGTIGPVMLHDVYVRKLSSIGDVWFAATYEASTSSVTVDSAGRPYFALNGPPGGLQGSTTLALSPDGSTVLVSRSLTGGVQFIALDGAGGLYVAGNTQNLAFLATPGSFEPLYPGGSNSGYAAKFDLTQAATGQIDWVANAATLVPGDNALHPEGAVAAGEIVSAFGIDLPPNPKVTFDGRAAPVLYADSNQINAVVPFEVSAPTTIFAIAGTGTFILPVWPAVPGLFSTDSSGSGQIAALNEDETVNSSTNPAKAGSIVSVYMTGGGAMTPLIGDGELGPLMPPFPMPMLGTSATVDYVAAPVLFAGQAPGLIAGAVQVNVQIPPGTPSGKANLVIYIGNYQTQTGTTTIAVQ